MTIFGADWSNHNWPRGPMDVAAAVRDGISFATHKVAEGAPGWYVDPYFDDWWTRARGVVPLLGAYYVIHPGDQIAQADFFLSQLDARAPGWRDGPFILQVDAEKFDYMTRAPSLTEIRAFCDRLVQRTGRRPIVYAPMWLYGSTLTGLGYPLWASNYGTNPTMHYRAAYPGDGSSRWGAYSGQTPAILQYGSRTTIGTQPTCDANAYRGTLDQLVNLLIGDDMGTITDPVQRAQIQNAEQMLEAIRDMADSVDRLNDAAGHENVVLPNAYVRFLKDLRGEVQAAQTAAQTLAARPPVQSAPVDPAAVKAAIEAALASPTVLAAIAKAVNDDSARRQQA